MTHKQSLALKITAVLWVIWGLVHMFAGVMTIVQPAPSSIAGVADAVDPSVFHATYHAATDALINQHGFNLLWIGLTTCIAAVYVWRHNLVAVFIAVLVGGLTDIGYFIFMDLGGFVHFLPGTVMTLISATAVLLSLWVWLGRRTPVVNAP